MAEEPTASITPGLLGAALPMVVALLRPYTIIFSTMSLDGRLALPSGYSLLSCSYDKQRQLLLRGMVDAVLVGANTVIVDNPGLYRRIGGGTKYYRIVVDSRLRTPPTARVYDTAAAPTIVLTSRRAPQNRVEELERRGVRVHVVGDGAVDLALAMRVLVEHYGVRYLLVEGGGRVNYSLLEGRLVDEVRVTVTPKLFGAGVGLVEDPGGTGFAPGRWPKLVLECYELCPCGRCIHLVYRVVDAACCPAGARGRVPACLSHRLARGG